MTDDYIHMILKNSAGRSKKKSQDTSSHAGPSTKNELYGSANIGKGGKHARFEDDELDVSYCNSGMNKTNHLLG